MARILFFLLLGAGALAGYRWYQRETKRVADALNKAKGDLGRRGARGTDAPSTLRQDPETGVYRPVSDGDDSTRN
jgi:hypothetical protein